MAAHCFISGNTEVDSVPIPEFQDLLEVRLNRKIIIEYGKFIANLFLNSHTLSHAKVQNNTSDIIGITHSLVLLVYWPTRLVSLGLNQ